MENEVLVYKQFLLFSPCFPQLYNFNASKCGIVWYWFNNFSAMIINHLQTKNRTFFKKIICYLPFRINPKYIVNFHDSKRRTLLIIIIFSFSSNVLSLFFCLIVSPFTKQQNFGHVQIQSICRRQNKCDSKTEICCRKS